MTRSEKNKIIFDCAFLSDDRLEDLYYKALGETLGSEVESMIDLGYDDADIRERIFYEKFLREKCDLIEDICVARGIRLFGDKLEEEIL